MEKIGTVSLWLGVADSIESLDAYTNTSYSEDGEFEGSEFTRSFDIQYHDENFKEAECIDRSKSVASLLEGFSYDDTIVPQFEELLGKELITGMNAVVLLYNFNYKGSKRDARTAQIQLRYMGSVRYE